MPGNKAIGIFLRRLVVEKLAFKKSIPLQKKLHAELRIFWNWQFFGISEHMLGVEEGS